MRENQGTFLAPPEFIAWSHYDTLCTIRTQTNLRTRLLFEKEDNGTLHLAPQGTDSETQILSTFVH